MKAKILLALVMTFLMIGCSNMIMNGALVEAQNDLDNKNYESAIENTLIAESFGELSASNTAKLFYIRARSLENLGRPAEATQNYQYVVEQHGNTAYAIPAQERLDELK